jgi:hypothetical protein
METHRHTTTEIPQERDGDTVLNTLEKERAWAAFVRSGLMEATQERLRRATFYKTRRELDGD